MPDLHAMVIWPTLANEWQYRHRTLNTGVQEIMSLNACKHPVTTSSTFPIDVIHKIRHYNWRLALKAKEFYIQVEALRN